MDAGFALVAATQLNAVGAKKASGGHFSTADFMPFAADRDEGQDATPEDLKRMFGIDTDG